MSFAIAEQEILLPSVTAEAIDWQNCRVFAGARDAGPAPREAMLAALGMEGGADVVASWSTGPAVEEVRHFRIAFRRVVMFQTICLATGPDSISVLKHDDFFPGDVQDEKQWTTYPAQEVVQLPASSNTRALRVTYRNYPLAWAPNNLASSLSPILLLSRRFISGTRLGSHRWSRANEQDRWIGFWNRSQVVSGMVLFGQWNADCQMDALPGEFSGHPLSAGAKDWKPIEQRLKASLRQATEVSTLTFQEPVVCRAIRITAPDLIPPRSSQPRMLPLVQIDDDASPPLMIPPPPFALNFDMPYDGFIAARISDSEGRHVRRLIAEVERPEGAVSEGWDLKGDLGYYVKSGVYDWTLVARPPLKLTYEITVYNAGHPPWRAPVKGGGWWMADHSPPVAAACAGDVMLLGSLGSEFGDSLIATDLEGNKIWRDEHQGVQRLVSDGRYVYVVNDGEIIRIDPKQGFKKTKLHTFNYSENLPGHYGGYYFQVRSGAAVKDGLLCVSYQAPALPWLRPAIKAHEVDLGRCFPPPPKPGKGARLEQDYSAGEKVLATFLAYPSSGQAYFGEAMSKGPAANTLLLALNRDVPIGSVLIPDGDIRVMALKTGRKLPPIFDTKAGLEASDAPLTDNKEVNDFDVGGVGDLDIRFNEDDWVVFKGGVSGQPYLALPEKGMHTRFLTFTSPNLKRLKFAVPFDRRYKDVTAGSELIFFEGQRVGENGWYHKRPDAMPITAGNPMLAALVWPKPVAMRGFVMTQPEQHGQTYVDIWVGASDTPVSRQALEEDKNWKQVYEVSVARVRYGSHAPTASVCDLGDTNMVRAFRIRVTRVPAIPFAQSPPGEKGGFGGLIALQPAGSDAQLPVVLNERITVLKLPDENEKTQQAKLLGHFSVSKPGPLTFGPDGALYADTEDGVVAIQNVSRRSAAEQIGTGVAEDIFKPVIARDRYKSASALAFNKQGHLLLLDQSSQMARIFDPKTGEQLRTFGKPSKEGWYDPEELSVPVSLAIDSRDKVWIVEQHFQPKRISRWSADGKFEKDFMGPTHYGSGGVMDQGDRTVVNHLGMKFRIDYDKRTWKLESRLLSYGSNYYLPDRVAYCGAGASRPKEESAAEHHGHHFRYLIGDRSSVTSFGDYGPVSGIFEEIEGAAVPIVAAGRLSSWHEYQSSKEMRKAWSNLHVDKLPFIWTDRNRDRRVQNEEVQLVKTFNMDIPNGPYIGDDLSINYREGLRVRPVSIREDGLPVYDIEKFEKFPFVTDQIMVTPEGETFVSHHQFIDAAGKLRWTYPDNYRSVQLSNKTPWGFYGRPPGVLSGGFQPLGYFKEAGEQIFCVGGNNGDYYAFTDDGLLVAAILGGPSGYGRRFFSMADCVPGKTDLSGLRKTVEDFQGHVTRADDGKVYAIAGKNHITVMRVDGFEQMKRISGKVEVKKDDLTQTVLWEQERARLEKSNETPNLAIVIGASKKPEIDGYARHDWPDGAPLLVREILNHQGNISEQTDARLAFDETFLYLAMTSIDSSPMLNSAKDPKLLFQSGDAFDLHLGFDRDADPGRTTPVSGDIRLLIAEVAEKPVVMLYRYKVKGKRLGGEPVTFTSPVARIEIEEVFEIKDAQVKFVRSGAGGMKSWQLEAAIPWSSLGAKAPEESVTLLGDIGVLDSDPDGIRTVGRVYWSNRSHVVMGDLPAEASINPSLWGQLNFKILDIGKVFDEEADENDANLLKLDLK